MSRSDMVLSMMNARWFFFLGEIVRNKPETELTFMQMFMINQVDRILRHTVHTFGSLSAI